MDSRESAWQALAAHRERCACCQEAVRLKDAGHGLCAGGWALLVECGGYYVEPPAVKFRPMSVHYVDR